MSKFSYDISIDEENQLIHLVVEGELTKEDGERVIIDARSISEEKNLPILCDITQGTINVSLADWFFLVRNKKIYPERSTKKTALLVHPDSNETYRFVENVSRNVGFNFRVFFREEDARTWLKNLD